MSSEGAYGKTTVDVVVYMLYLAAFILLLLYASTFLFGLSWLTIVFGAFIAAVIGIVAVFSRMM